MNKTITRKTTTNKYTIDFFPRHRNCQHEQTIQKLEDYFYSEDYDGEGNPLISSTYKRVHVSLDIEAISLEAAIKAGILLIEKGSGVEISHIQIWKDDIL